MLIYAVRVHKFKKLLAIEMWIPVFQGVIKLNVRRMEFPNTYGILTGLLLVLRYATIVVIDLSYAVYILNILG